MSATCATGLGLSLVSNSVLFLDLRTAWVWFVLVGLLSQPITALLARVFFPEYLAHVQARLPFALDISLLALLPLLVVSLLGEELTYRALIQGRLALFIGGPVAILVASLLFGMAHLAAEPVLVVLVDVGMKVVDSIWYGIIFARTGNLMVTWAAHLLGDVLGLAVIFTL